MKKKKNEKTENLEEQINEREENNSNELEMQVENEEHKESYEEIKERFTTNGVFDADGFDRYFCNDTRTIQEFWRDYEKSPQYQRAEQRILKLLTRFINRQVEQYVDSFTEINGPIKIKSDAYEKGQYIAKRIVNLHPKPLEVFMYAVGSNEKNIIEDIELPDSQIVGTAFCRVISSENLEEKIARENKKIVGWSHSHAFFNTYHSPTDFENTREISSVYGFDKEVSFPEIGWKFNMSYSPSIVFNAKGEKPDAAYGIQYPKFEDGKLVSYEFKLQKTSIDITRSNMEQEIDQKLKNIFIA